MASAAPSSQVASGNDNAAHTSMLLQPHPPPSLLPSAHGLPQDESEAAALGALFPHPPISPLTDMGISTSEAMLSPALNSVPFSVAGAALAGDFNASTIRSAVSPVAGAPTGLGVLGVNSPSSVGSAGSLPKPTSPLSASPSLVGTPTSASSILRKGSTILSDDHLEDSIQARLDSLATSPGMHSAQPPLTSTILLGPASTTTAAPLNHQPPPAAAEEAVASAIIEENRPATSSISIDGAVIPGSEVATASASLDLLADAIIATPSVSSSMMSTLHAAASVGPEGSHDISPTASRPRSIMRDQSASPSMAGSPRSPHSHLLSHSGILGHAVANHQSVALSPSSSTMGGSRHVSSPLPFPQAGADPISPASHSGIQGMAGMDLATSLGLAVAGHESPYSTRASVSGPSGAGGPSAASMGSAGSPILSGGSGTVSPFGMSSLGLGLAHAVPGPGLPTMESAILPNSRSLSLYSNHSGTGGGAYPGSRSISPVAQRTARTAAVSGVGARSNSSVADKARPKSMILDGNYANELGSPGTAQSPNSRAGIPVSPGSPLDSVRRRGTSASRRTSGKRTDGAGSPLLASMHRTDMGRQLSLGAERRAGPGSPASLHAREVL
ncbi:hypothetical protein OC846_003284 [Tilletia horrida]|uniref:Uncharacterized protein n=1 Tax=Tilletia horrida TaxID=155126 RepID=A0AAN6JRW6_9BASI|nr:hypothetical protein OC845_006012 [Tilletia horrida]KAK0551506.1 hypothetical protein OC846_003284 [Tilletia horrida]KAK0566495.1 hypothetical protein OC861_003185 [Tilletia horrida]